ncbi:MAG: YicC/YloC family endoribonuclease, partial [Gemmatimonadaceae bacterium]
MVRSMTGFGQADGAVGSVHVSVEIRTVNHRFFSPSIKLPSAFGKWEAEVREALRLRVSRGHVTLSARTLRAPSAQLSGIDTAKFATAVETLRALTDQHSLAGGVDLASVLRLSDVISNHQEPDDAETGSSAELV